MGWRLAEEVAWARPESPGPEWWTLMDIAQYANDETRQGWPGRDYLAARAKKTPRTVDRYISALVKAGALVCVKPAGRGKRPVYEILALPVPATSCDTDDVPRKPVDNSASCDTSDVARSGSDRATQTMSHDPGTRTAFVRQNGVDRATQTMSHLPSVLPSVIHGVAVVGGPVEGDAAAPPVAIQLPSGPWLNGNGTKPPHPEPPASPRGRRETDAERRRQAAALNAWENDHPEEAAGAAPA
jgi:hypothetical protein